MVGEDAALTRGTRQRNPAEGRRRRSAGHRLRVLATVLDERCGKQVGNGVELVMQGGGRGDAMPVVTKGGRHPRALQCLRGVKDGVEESRARRQRTAGEAQTLRAATEDVWREDGASGQYNCTAQHVSQQRVHRDRERVTYSCSPRSNTNVDVDALETSHQACTRPHCSRGE